MTRLLFYDQHVILYGMNWTKHMFDTLRTYTPDQMVYVAGDDGIMMLVALKYLNFVETIV